MCDFRSSIEQVWFFYEKNSVKYINLFKYLQNSGYRYFDFAGILLKPTFAQSKHYRPSVSYDIVSNQPAVCQYFKENDNSTNNFGTNTILAKRFGKKTILAYGRTCKMEISNICIS